MPFLALLSWKVGLMNLLQNYSIKTSNDHKWEFAHVGIMPDTNDWDGALLLNRFKTCIGFLKSPDVMLYEVKKKEKNRIEVKLNKDKKSAVIN